MELDRLAAAKLWLVSAPVAGRPGAVPDGPRDLPYLSHALYAMVPVESPEVVTMTVDERWRVYVNPDWLATATVQAIGRELAHLVWHLLADHAGRARDQDVTTDTARHWHTAADLTVNATCAPDALVPAGLPSAADLHLPLGRSAEEYYAILSRLPATDGAGRTPGSESQEQHSQLRPDDGCGSGADGIPRSHELGDTDASTSPGAADDLASGVPPEDARHIRHQVAIDYTDHAKRRGDTPGDAWRWAASILEPRIAWEPLLAKAVRRAVGYAAGRGEYTYTRPSRHRTPGIVLPGQRRPVPRVAIVVDTSGSVDDQLLSRALGEVDGVLRALGVGDTAISVYSVDAAVHLVQQVRMARDVKLAGGGGTDLRPGLAAATAARPRPDVVVVLTDGYTPWPSSAPPGSAVVVALLGRPGDLLPPTPAWAARIECRLE
jgi:predicted metal-dependent peptidase